jgi:hypothetical protein
LYTLIPAKSSGGGDRLQLLIRELRRVAAGGGQVGVRVPALEHDRQVWCVDLTGSCRGRFDVVGRVNYRYGGGHVLGQSDLDADRLHQGTILF